MVNNPADMKAVEAEILATIAKFHDSPVDARQLADTKSAIKYGFLMALETAQDVSFSVMETVVATGRLEPIDDYFRTLDALTPDDVRETARKHLTPAARTIVTMVQES
jgi:zinc protease